MHDRIYPTKNTMRTSATITYFYTFLGLKHKIVSHLEDDKGKCELRRKLGKHDK